MMAAQTRTTAPHDPDWRSRYAVGRRVGSGGFAEVFEARDLRRQRRVALKVVPEQRGMPARIGREVQAAQALSHPNIVALYDWFGDGEHSYLAWEFVSGWSLADLRRRLGDAEIVAAGAELLQALAYAHAQGIVHRDVKPQNVMLNEEGHVKVMDFGVARLLNADTLTQDGDVIGTVAYMSPEQAQGRRVGPPSDVYSAGMLLYELLADEHPLRGDTSAQTMANVIAGRVPSLATLRPDLPHELVELIDDACGARAAARPTAAEFAAQLQRLDVGAAARQRRWRRAETSAGKLRLVWPAVERLGGAALATVGLGLALRALPAYPPGWTLILLSVTAAVWAVVPRAGLAVVLGLLAFPFFNVSAAAGGLWLVLAVLAFILGQRRPLMVLWPLLAVLAAPLLLWMLVPVGAAVFGRWRAAATAAWAAATAYVIAALSGIQGPLTLFAAGATAPGITTSAGPLKLAADVIQLLGQPSCLAQIALWALLAFAFSFLLALPTRSARLWLWSLTLAVAFTVAALLPGLVWPGAADLGSLVLNVLFAAGVILLPVILVPADETEEATP